MYIISIAVDLNNAPPRYVSKTKAHPKVMREVNPYKITGILRTVLTMDSVGICQAFSELTGRAMNRNRNTWQQNTNRKPTKIMVMSVYAIRRARCAYVLGESRFTSIVLLLSFSPLLPTCCLRMIWSWSVSITWSWRREYKTLGGMEMKQTVRRAINITTSYLGASEANVGNWNSETEVWFIRDIIVVHANVAIAAAAAAAAVAVAIAGWVINDAAGILPRLDVVNWH